MPRTSIIIPAYNSAEFIAETVQSALAQPDSEVVVVDDGSTDETAAIIKEMAGVSVIQQANAGDSAARNAGLQIAQGEYVQFLDHDDVLQPDAIAHHLAEFAANPDCEMTVGANYLIDRKGTLLGENRPSIGRFSGRDVVLGTTPSFSQCLYRRSALERIGGFRSRAKAAADHDLNIRLLKGKEAGVTHAQFVMSYRQHDGQQTKSPSRLYAMHMAVLRDLLGPAGECENARLLREAEVHWKRYYGRFIGSEAAKSLFRGELGRAGKAISAYVQCLPEGLPGTLAFLKAKVLARTTV